MVVGPEPFDSQPPPPPPERHGWVAPDQSSLVPAIRRERRAREEPIRVKRCVCLR